MPNELSHETVKHAVDATSLGVLLASLAQWLPAIAALFSLIWSLIRIYETDTVQGILNKLKGKK